MTGVGEVGDYGVDGGNGRCGPANVEVEDCVAEGGKIGDEVGASEARAPGEDDALGRGGHLGCAMWVDGRFFWHLQMCKMLRLSPGSIRLRCALYLEAGALVQRIRYLNSNCVAGLLATKGSSHGRMLRVAIGPLTSHADGYTRGLKMT